MATKKKRNAVPAPTALTAQVKKFQRPENYPVVYANNVQISVGNWDFPLDFGEINPPPPGGKAEDAVVMQKIGIVLTPGIAASLAKILEYYGKLYKEQLAGQEWTPPST